jgi:hypothetical protein
MSVKVFDNFYQGVKYNYTYYRDLKIMFVETDKKIETYYKVDGWEKFPDGAIGLVQSCSGRIDVVYKGAPVAPQVVHVFCAPPPASQVSVFYPPAAPAPAPPAPQVHVFYAPQVVYVDPRCNATCKDGSQCQNKIAKSIGNLTRCQLHSTGKNRK